MSETEFDSRALFERFAKRKETLDEDWTEGMQEAIRNKGYPVGRQEWDSGAPGAGAGVTYVYAYRGLFFSDNDFGMCGPFSGFMEAAKSVCLLGVSGATTRIWVAEKYRAEAKSALELFDGISKRRASAIFRRGTQ